MSTGTPPARSHFVGLRAGRGRVNGLDGLRAIAIISVLVFHLDRHWLPGGFIGVDVFFVVSGFLISTLLMRELERTGRVSLTDFYLRRARRLLPALVFVVVGAISLAFVVDRELLLDMGRQTLGAGTFSTNWLEIAAGSDYFAATQPLLLMNFWSLAVEEQFYLFWPVLLILLLATTRTLRPRVTIVAAVAIASAVLMSVMLDPAAATRVYYGTDTHLFGLMIGVVLALTWCSPGHSVLWSDPWQRARGAILLGGLSVLAILLLTLSETTAFTFRGGLFLASLSSAALIASLLAGPQWWAAVMDLPPLRWIGERSYGLYLWHWPLILLTDSALPSTPGTTRYTLVRLLAVALTLLITEASYVFIEMPIRRDGFRATLARWGTALRGEGRTVLPVRVATALGALCLVMSGIGLAIAPTQTAAERMAADNATLLAQIKARRAATPMPTSTPSLTTAAVTSTSIAPAAPTPTLTGDFNGIQEKKGAKYPPAVPRPTGLGHIAPNSTFTMPRGDEITIIGDSMVATTAAALEWYYPGVDLDGRSNRQWDEALGIIRERSSGLRRAVVIDVGTNGSVKEDDLRQALDVIGPRRMVVLMTIYGRSDWIDQSNDVLRKVAAEHPNVIVTEWNAVAKAHPDILQPDKTHPTTAGAHSFAKTIASGLVTLSEKATGHKVNWTEPVIP
ncbi:acyltransferase family protein [Arsenicicoccus dermatophilus]|uniref:acyltransferase family protein n=1 Tax=Arsenicicoccus dermatophilus TaxID=1076331 RepID=UPI001F4CD5A3|nr:acyltransferase [Arsenicicoccus dermatophilus]